MLRSHPKHKNTSILLVEGPSDQAFFRNLVWREVKIIACEGKTNVLYATELLIERNLSGILGVVDDDFDSYLPNEVLEKFSQPVKKKMKSRIYHTDTHDLETMLIRSYALEKFLNIYAEPQRLQEFRNRFEMEFIDQIGDLTSIIGKFKLLNLREKWQLSFKKLRFGKFIDSKHIGINIERFLREVFRRSEHATVDQEEVLKTYLEIKEREYIPWKISSGHDYMQILLLCLQDYFGIPHKIKRFEKVHQIEDILILSYEYDFFRNTHLYEQMLNWEQKHPDFQLFN